MLPFKISSQTLCWRLRQPHAFARANVPVTTPHPPAKLARVHFRNRVSAEPRIAAGAPLASSAIANLLRRHELPHRIIHPQHISVSLRQTLAHARARGHRILPRSPPFLALTACLNFSCLIILDRANYPRASPQ